MEPHTLRLDFDIDTPDPDFSWHQEIPNDDFLACLILAFDKDFDEAKNFYFRTLNDLRYHYYKGLDDTNADLDEATVNFNTAEIQQAINFIDNELVPLVENEERPFVRFYGNENKIYKRIDEINATSGFKISYNGGEDFNFQYPHGQSVYLTFVQFSDVMKESLRLNIPYTSYLH
jgi:hypothetical protein